MKWQPNRENTSTPHPFAGSFNFATMLLNYFMADGKAKARAFSRAVLGEERFENIFEHFLIHANPRIFDCNFCLAILLPDHYR